MAENYKILYLFENTEVLITEIQRLDLAADADISAVYHWLFLDKRNQNMVKLWFRSMDSSADVEERYFEQGYLKFSQNEATFIEKYNSSQYKLSNNSKRKADTKIMSLIEEYLQQPWCFSHFFYNR